MRMMPRMITGFSDTGGSVRGAGPGRPSATRPVSGPNESDRCGGAGRRGFPTELRRSPGWRREWPTPLGRHAPAAGPVGGASSRTGDEIVGPTSGSNCHRGAPEALADRRDSVVMGDGEHLVWHQDPDLPGRVVPRSYPSVPAGLPGRRRTPRASALPVVRDVGDGAGVLRLGERPRRRDRVGQV